MSSCYCIMLIQSHFSVAYCVSVDRSSYMSARLYFDQKMYFTTTYNWLLRTLCESTFFNVLLGTRNFLIVSLPFLFFFSSIVVIDFLTLLSTILCIHAVTLTIERTRRRRCLCRCCCCKLLLPQTNGEEEERHWTAPSKPSLPTYAYVCK